MMDRDLDLVYTKLIAKVFDAVFQYHFDAFFTLSFKSDEF